MSRTEALEGATMIEKALSIRQPWAHAIVGSGSDQGSVTRGGSDDQ